MVGNKSHKFNSINDQDKENTSPETHHRRNYPGDTSLSVEECNFLHRPSIRKTLATSQTQSPGDSISSSNRSGRNSEQHVIDFKSGSLNTNVSAEESDFLELVGNKRLKVSKQKPVSEPQGSLCSPKSDQVLCKDCGQELTAKCLLRSCAGDQTRKKTAAAARAQENCHEQ